MDGEKDLDVMYASPTEVSSSQIDATQWWARGMQRNVAPVTYYTRTRLSPRVAALSRQVVPVEWLGVEFAFGPSRKTIHHVALTNVLPSSAWAMGWFWELVLECLIRTHTNQKDPPTVLRHAVILRV